MFSIGTGFSAPCFRCNVCSCGQDRFADYSQSTCGSDPCLQNAVTLGDIHPTDFYDVSDYNWDVLRLAVVLDFRSSFCPDFNRIPKGFVSAEIDTFGNLSDILEAVIDALDDYLRPDERETVHSEL